MQYPSGAALSFLNSAISIVSGSSIPSTVTNLSHIFDGLTSFNLDITGWNTSAVTNMSAIFAGARVFNQNICSQAIVLYVEEKGKNHD